MTTENTQKTPEGDGFVAAFGTKRGTSDQAEPAPRDLLSEFLRWFDEEHARRSIDYDDFVLTLEEFGLALEEPSFHWGYDDHDEHPAALWERRTPERRERLLGFIVLSLGQEWRVIDCEFFTRSLYRGRTRAAS